VYGQNLKRIIPCAIFVQGNAPHFLPIGPFGARFDPGVTQSHDISGLVEIERSLIRIIGGFPIRGIEHAEVIVGYRRWTLGQRVDDPVFEDSGRGHQIDRAGRVTDLDLFTFFSFVFTIDTPIG
jgi:hypothetical protein